jgi:hypothetical protein
VQIGDRAVAANFDASPNHGTDAQDKNFELVDDYLLRVRHRGILSHFESFISPEKNRSHQTPATTFVVIDEVATEDWGVAGVPVEEFRQGIQQQSQ